jgi:hypothetical protein
MGLFVQAAAVAVGEETGRRGEVMVEVTVGRRLSEQWRGGGVMPQVFSWKVNPNERVNSVDFGQTTANLGHHLETITNKP